MGRIGDAVTRPARFPCPAITIECTKLARFWPTSSHDGALVCTLLGREGTMLALSLSAIGAFVAAAVLLIRSEPGRDRGALRHRFRRMFETYRPELHYMRGPGPKWREKRAAAGRGRS